MTRWWGYAIILFMYEDPKSKISQLEKILDKREDLISKKIKRHELRDREITVNQDWNDEEPKAEEAVFNSEIKKTGWSFSTKVLLGSIIFFILAFLVVLYKFMGGGNLISGDNLEVSVKAPISVSGGEVVSFEIDVKNNNNIALSGADLGVTFPLGSKDAINSSLPAKRAQIFLGDILPGQTAAKNLSVILFGSQNEKKNIDIVLEYKVAGSNSVFNKTKSISILINSSPVNIVVTGPTEVNTNQSVDFTAEITSNSGTVLKNLLLKADYPAGFSFVGSNPDTFSKNNLWLIGDLEPGAKRTIKISGILSGQEGEERGFNFNIGSQSSADNLSIDVPFGSSFSSVTIRRPFVSADVFLNDINASNDYISKAGSQINTTVKWQNNLPYDVSDVSIVLKLTGNAIDKSSFQIDGGFYRSIDNTIIFDKTTDPVFADLQPGQSGESSFSFSSFNSSSVTGAGLINPTIVLAVSVKGKRVDYESGQNDVLFSDSHKIKITGDPRLFAKALYYVGLFRNTGPLPPKAEQETTYTVVWTITNPLNDLSGTKVSAVIPPYIKWLSAVSPSQEKVNYDESNRIVTWEVGNVSSGAGTTLPAREVSFQISLLPSVDQIGIAPSLIGDTTLTAKDNFTLTPVTTSFTSLNTQLKSDPYFKPETDIVAQ